MIRDIFNDKNYLAVGSGEMSTEMLILRMSDLNGDLNKLLIDIQSKCIGKMTQRAKRTEILSFENTFDLIQTRFQNLNSSNYSVNKYKQCILKFKFLKLVFYLNYKLLSNMLYAEMSQFVIPNNTNLDKMTLKKCREFTKALLKHKLKYKKIFEFNLKTFVDFIQNTSSNKLEFACKFCEKFYHPDKVISFSF